MWALPRPSGSYVVLLEQPGARFEAKLTLTEAREAALTSGIFVRLAPERTTTRGSGRLRLVPVGVSLLPPYDNYGREPSRARTYLAFHALYGEPAQLRGVSLGLGGSGARESAHGLMLAGIFNDAPHLQGLELAPINVAQGEVVGAQLALFNFAGKLEGVLLALASWARRLRGVQLAALSTAGDVRGAQLALLNVAAGDVQGAQLALLNVAAGDISGAQLGLLNVAAGDVNGVQLGLVNYARSADVGLSPFSITREGGVHAQLLTGSLALMQLAARFDARYTYSFFGLGWHPLGTREERSYLFGAGFGGKIPVASMLSIEIDTAAYLVQPLLDWVSGVPCGATQLRVLGRLELYKHLSLIAGPSFDVLINGEPAHRLYPGLTRPGFRAGAGDVEVSYGVGWAAGLRF